MAVWRLTVLEVVDRGEERKGGGKTDGMWSFLVRIVGEDADSSCYLHVVRTGWGPVIIAIWKERSTARKRSTRKRSGRRNHTRHLSPRFPPNSVFADLLSFLSLSGVRREGRVAKWSTRRSYTHSRYSSASYRGSTGSTPRRTGDLGSTPSALRLFCGMTS